MNFKWNQYLFCSSTVAFEQTAFYWAVWDKHDSGEEKAFVKTLQENKKMPNKTQDAVSQGGHGHNQGLVGVSSIHWLPMFLQVKRKPTSIFNMKRKNYEADGLIDWPTLSTMCV